MKRTLLLEASILLLAQGCSTLSHQLPSKGSLEFVRSDVLYANLDRAEVVFHYNYVSAEAIKFDSIVVDYELYLDGKKAVSTRGLSYTGTPNDTLALNVPVRVQWLDFFGTLEKLVQTAQSGRWDAPSQMHAVATMYLSGSSFQLACDTKGRLILPHIPQYMQIFL